jgi:hypothetical protein
MRCRTLGRTSPSACPSATPPAGSSPTSSSGCRSSSCAPPRPTPAAPAGSRACGGRCSDRTGRPVPSHRRHDRKRTWVIPERPRPHVGGHEREPRGRGGRSNGRLTVASISARVSRVWSGRSLRRGRPLSACSSGIQHCEERGAPTLQFRDVDLLSHRPHTPARAGQSCGTLARIVSPRQAARPDGGPPSRPGGRRCHTASTFSTSSP